MNFPLNEDHLLFYIHIFHFHIGHKQRESTLLSNSPRYVKGYFFVSRYTAYVRVTSISSIRLKARRERYWNDIDRGITQYTRKDQSQCQFVIHRTYTEWHGIDSWSER